MNKKDTLGYICIVIPLIISIYFFINSVKLIPAGYELAIDGYLISKTIMFVFSLYLLSKLGFFIIKQKNS